MEHWADDFEHESITDENREAFSTHMAKFDTEGDAVMDGYDLAKQKGNLFKIPESLENLPDDESRTDFTSQVHKLFGIRKTKDISELANVNLKDGMAEGAVYNEDFANSFKQFVVDNNLNVNDMPKLAKFFHVSMAKLGEAQKAKTEADNLAAAKSCNDALIAHADIGSEERLLVLTEQFTRAMETKVGLTPDEVEELADDLAVSKLSRHPALTRVLLQQIAPLAAEASTEKGGGPTHKATKPEDPEEGSPSYVALGYSTPEQAEAYKNRQAAKAPA